MNLDHVVSNIVAAAAIGALLAVVLYEYVHRNDPTVLCRWCGTPTDHPLHAEGEVYSPDTGELTYVYDWPFCSARCMGACMAVTDPKEQTP